MSTTSSTATSTSAPTFYQTGQRDKRQRDGSMPTGPSTARPQSKRVKIEGQEQEPPPPSGLFSATGHHSNHSAVPQINVKPEPFETLLPPLEPCSSLESSSSSMEMPSSQLSSSSSIGVSSSSLKQQQAKLLYNEGVSLLQQNNKNEAISKWREAAKLGYITSYIPLYRFLLKSPEKESLKDKIRENIGKLKEEAAKSDFLDAYNIAGLYIDGGSEIFPVNFFEAAQWMELAREKCSTIGQTEVACERLGYLYFTGDPSSRFPVNLPEAFKWSTSAAANGSVMAQYRVYEIYIKGYGEKADALMYLKMAARGKHTQAMTTLQIIELAQQETKQKALALNQQIKLMQDSMKIMQDSMNQLITSLNR